MLTSTYNIIPRFNYIISITLFIFMTQQSQAEDIIDQVRNHTVKITTAITYAFGLENKTSMHGAGFLIDKSKGWILTNAHVAARSPSTITVRFRDEDNIEAQKLYVDNHLDVAIIKVSADKIPERAIQANLNCEDDVHAGTSVIAFGHPWDLDYTATRGIISGSRTVEGTEVLQTDAALNPGNSGGPLIDATSGKVLGINSSHFEPSKTEGMNFAVPMSLVCRIINLLKDGQDPAPPKLPLTFATSLKSQELVIASSYGNLNEILRPGDRILKVDENSNIFSQSRFLGNLRGKTVANILILRNNTQIKHAIETNGVKDQVKLQGISFSGILVGPPTAKEAPDGLFVVHSVEPSSLAEQSQFCDGDQIVAIDGKAIASYNELKFLLAKSNNQTIEFIVRKPNFNMISGRYEYFARKLEVSDPKVVNENGIISIR